MKLKIFDSYKKLLKFNIDQLLEKKINFNFKFIKVNFSNIAEILDKKSIKLKFDQKLAEINFKKKLTQFTLNLDSEP